MSVLPSVQVAFIGVCKEGHEPSRQAKFHQGILRQCRKASTSPANVTGIVLMDIHNPCAFPAGHLRGHKMQFYSWKTGQPIGHELLAPVWLAWDPLVTACALAYPDAIVICRAQPSFMPVITLPIQVTFPLGSPEETDTTCSS